MAFFFTNPRLYEVMAAIDQMSVVIQSTAGGIERFISVSQNLTTYAKKMSEIVSYFKME